MYLPLGDPTFNFQYTIAVTVMDKFYFGTKLVFNVTVSFVFDQFLDLKES